MWQCTIDGKLLRLLTTGITTVTNSAELIASKDHLSCRCIDGSRVFLGTFSLDTEITGTLLPDPYPTDIMKMHQVLSKTELLKFKCDDTLKVSMGKSTYTFDKLTANAVSRPPTVNLPQLQQMTIEASDLVSAIKDILAYYNNDVQAMWFETTPKELKIYDTDKKVVCVVDLTNEVTPQKCKFHMSYISNIMGLLKLVGGSIDFGLASNTPCSLGGSTEHFTYHFMIAHMTVGDG